LGRLLSLSITLTSSCFFKRTVCPITSSLELKASERIRTPDPLITNQLLYQLSYAGAIFHLQAFNFLLKKGVNDEEKGLLFMKFLFPLSNLRTLLSLVLEKNIQNYIQNSKSAETFCQEMIF
jgi:hypothetical protein